jgi:hypothetical protein
MIEGKMMMSKKSCNIMQSVLYPFKRSYLNNQLKLFKARNHMNKE